MTLFVLWAVAWAASLAAAFAWGVVEGYAVAKPNRGPDGRFVREDDWERVYGARNRRIAGWAGLTAVLLMLAIVVLSLAGCASPRPAVTVERYEDVYGTVELRRDERGVLARYVEQ